jgi:predicted  nucleic acid-binding Zn-ribbon protein
LKEQLKLLEALQQHDARLQDLEEQLKALPEKLDQMRSDLARIEKIVAAEREKLAEAERWRTEQEKQLKFEEEAIVKAKSKLQTVKTSREHMAADRELKSTRDMKEEREGEILKLIEATEQTKKMIAEHEADVAKLRDEVAQEETAIQARIGELQEQAKALRVEREGAVKGIRPDVLKRYSTIRLRRGLAVVPVHKGVCAGCHMAIPPQLYNNLQRGNSIEHCPLCGRIIYWDQLMAPPAPAEAAEPAPAPEVDEEHAEAAPRGVPHTPADPQQAKVAEHV